MLKEILQEKDIVNNKGFSAIELLAIIVVLTIIALVSIPIVLNAVNNEKKIQNRKSIDTYGENIEIAFERYKIAHDDLFSTDIDELKEYLTVDVKIKCDVIEISETGSVHLSDCSVNGEKILDDRSKPYEYNTKK